MDLLARYPLQTTYPGTGTLTLVLWWSHNEGQRLISSEDLDGAEVMLFAKTVKYRDLEIRDFRVADLVPVPAEARLAFAKEACRAEQYQFESWLRDLAQAHIRHFGKAPAGFRPCRHKSEETRWRCAKCDGSGVIAQADVADLHARDDLWAEFRASHGRAAHAAHLPPACHPESEAVPEYVAVLDEGHHRQGVHYLPYHSWLERCPEPVLFFFRGEGAEPPAALTGLVDEVRAAVAAEAQARGCEQESRNREWEAKEAALAVKVFALIEHGV